MEKRRPTDQATYILSTVDCATKLTPEVLQSRGGEMITREELYELVWSAPMIKVGEKFKVSGSYMARVCSTLRVPRPERGYWAKLTVGKAPEKPRLPDAQPGDQLSWSQGEVLPAPRRARLVAVQPRPPRGKLTRAVTGIHGLIRDAKGNYDSGYKVEEGQHLRPYKRLLVDVTASMAGLDKALSFASDLFNALESAGHHYYSRLWSPQRPTVVYVGSVAFGLAVIETSENVEVRYVNGRYVRESDYKPLKASARYVDHSWTTTKDIPCGRLRLVVYAPYSGVSWSMLFQESKDRALTTEIAKIVKSIENSSALVVEKVKEAERAAEIRRQEWAEQQARWRQEEDRRRVAESIKESHEQLSRVIENWARVVSLEQFFVGIENRVQGLTEEQRPEILKRLALAREFVGTQDPLDFFRSWKTPVERYIPLSMRKSEAVEEEKL